MQQTICDNKTQVLYIGACKVKSIVVYSDGADGDVTLYNGSSEKEVMKGKIGSLSNSAWGIFLGDGVIFDKGIYVVVNAATTFYTISFSVKDE
jgi:hypothetical protein